jgi:hypothetical protein
MRCVGEPVLHALAVEPREVRAGDIVRVTFRTRNLGTQPSPAGRVVFALGAGLDAVDAEEVDVEPVAPGEYVVATVQARVAVPVEERAEIGVCAALHLPEAVLETNACTVSVRSRAVLDGPASGVFVEAIDANTVRVRAVVMNEGDGPACGVRIVVPAPIGCGRADGDGPAVHDVARLDAGERAEVAFEACIVAPVAEVRADAGEVRFADGRRVALPMRGAVVPAPRLAEPRVVVTPSRRRADIALDVPNDGWADARNVRVRIALPAELQLVAGSVVVDGVPVGASGPSPRRAANGRGAPAGARVERNGAAPLKCNRAARVGRDSAVRVERDGTARLERDGAAHVVVISAVPARCTVRVAMAALVPAACSDGLIAVAVDGHEIEVPFVPSHVREVRVRVVDSPSTASPGDAVRIVARVVNAGDVSETVSVGVADHPVPALPDMVSCTLAPGAAAAVDLVLHVPDEAADDMVLDAAVIVCDASGERARAAVSVVVRDRAWLSLDMPPVRDGALVRYTVRNGGSTAARDVTARFEETAVQLDAIAAGAIAVVDVEEHVAGSGGSLYVGRRDALALPPIDDRAAAVVHAALHAPERVVAGASFAVRLDLDVEDDADALSIRVPAVAGCGYVPGSTLLDGRGLFDRTGCAPAGEPSPLDGDGLSLRGVAGGTRVTLAWSLIADPVLRDESLSISAIVIVEGDERPVAPVTVAVGARDAFPARPSGARYHVEACTIPPGAHEASPWSPAFDAASPAFDAASPAFGGATPGFDEEPPSAQPASSMSSATGEAQSDVLNPPHDDRLDAAKSFVFDAAHVSRPEPRVAFSMRLDGARVDDISRLLHAARGRGLVAHLFALRFFFPDAVDVHDASASEALCAVHLAVRDVFDRLFVKLRIPGFDVTADDLDDPSLRGALIALFERLLDVAPDHIVFEESPAALDRDGVRRMLAAFADAPYGAPAVLRALVALLPARCDDDPALATLLRRHANMLDDVLSRYEGLPLELFDDALAHRTDAALDDARDSVLAVLRAHVPAVEATC